jgi:hypothetical protein
MVSTRSSVLSAIGGAALGAALVVACFYPGYMSNDSIDQLGQARAGIYSAGHPPLMAWIWHWIDRVTPGPLGMVLLQQCLFFGGVALLAVLAISNGSSGLSVLAVGLLPPLFALLGTVWKDVQLGSSLVAAFALLCLAVARGSRTPAFAALALLLYGCAMRHNAIPAILPLAIMAAAVVIGRVRWRSAIAGIAGIVVTAFIVGATWRINRVLTDGRSGAPAQLQPYILHDLVGISLASERDYLPDYLHRGTYSVSLDSLRGRYLAESSDPLIFGKGPSLWAATAPENVAELRSSWMAAVRAHPRDYLRHRWAMTRTLIGLGPHVWYPYHSQIDSNPFGITLAETAQNRAAMQFLNWVHDSILFRGWAYLGVLIVAAIRCVVRGIRACWATSALSASGLLYFFPYVFVAPSCDFRYLWWTVVSAVLLPLTILVERRWKPMMEAPSTLEPAW